MKIIQSKKVPKNATISSGGVVLEIMDTETAIDIKKARLII